MESAPTCNSSASQLAVAWLAFVELPRQNRISERIEQQLQQQAASQFEVLAPAELRRVRPKAIN
ncbi:hypothetical protein T4D_15485 [Trichinella pseudospiralis]|uniref:Uncharacterized protein n=1 Tax=Trichinella pseudospiralis TaxID=6337 RepID=A0A0V1FNH0_TRIPS|nr:hypothetical protein T4D_15485 [Trichinella pseudospiralis]